MSLYYQSFLGGPKKFQSRIYAIKQCVLGPYITHCTDCQHRKIDEEIKKREIIKQFFFSPWPTDVLVLPTFSPFLSDLFSLNLWDQSWLLCYFGLQCACASVSHYAWLIYHSNWIPFYSVTHSGKKVAKMPKN